MLRQCLWPKVTPMKTSKLFLPKLFVIILLGFSGCALPVGFGSHKAVLASEMGVTYEYDSYFGGYERMMKAAKEHCDKFNKRPYPKEISTRTTVSFVTFGLLKVDVQTFDCR